MQWPAGGHCAYFRQAWASQPGVEGPRHCPFSVSKSSLVSWRDGRRTPKQGLIYYACRCRRPVECHCRAVCWASFIPYIPQGGGLACACRHHRGAMSALPVQPWGLAIRPLRLMWLAIRSPVSVAAAGISLAWRGPGHAVRLKPPALREWRPWRPWGAAALVQSITP